MNLFKSRCDQNTATTIYKLHFSLYDAMTHFCQEIANELSSSSG